MFKKFIVALCLIVLPNILLAVDAKPKKTLEDIEKKYSKQVDYSDSQKQTMREMLRKNQYYDFFNFLKANPVSSINYIDFLESVKEQGHIPLYWLMADYYSTSKDKEQETHFWYYTAIIMTTQDSYLCYDQTARYASEKLTRNFPNTFNLVRKTPKYINPAMREVTFFISNIKERINPIWSCSYGTSSVRENNNILINQDLWEDSRLKVFNKFTSKYQQ